MNNQSLDSDGRKRLLRCEHCGASLVSFLSDLLRYTREGWPKGCNQTMGLFVEEPLPFVEPAPSSNSTNRPTPVIIEAQTLLEQAKDGAEEVVAQIEKSQELLNSSVV